MADEGALRVTDAAREMVLGIRAGEENAETLALWLEINGAANGSYTYDMWFQQASDAGEGDAVATDEGLTVVVAASSVAQMLGATTTVSPSSVATASPSPASEACWNHMS